ncbi:hypothetical protein EON82_01735 [bacterium]|nr:MAG: hypothetical protein EON82_01735 [bacterium]
MNPNGYPRPNYTPSGAYDKDRGWGMAVIACAILGVFCGLLMGLGGAALGVFGAAAATSGGREATEGGAILGLGGGLIALVGFAIMACSAVQVAGGVGIMQSKKWGFVMTAVLSIISLILNVPALPAGIPGVLISAVFLWYCWTRLSGKDGPTPV